jgi:hypothetical protein
MSESIASPPVSSEAASLWRNTNFRRLWAGQSVSLVGSAVSYIALPLVGIVLLRLDALQVGGHRDRRHGTDGAPVAFLGGIVDQVPRRRLCAACDIGRAILVGSIPVAVALGVLSYWQLVIVAAFMGLLTALFGVAHQTLLPEVVPDQHLNIGNSRLEASQSAAEVSGPARHRPPGRHRSAHHRSRCRPARVRRRCHHPGSDDNARGRNLLRGWHVVLRCWQPDALPDQDREHLARAGHRIFTRASALVRGGRWTAGRHGRQGVRLALLMLSS